MMSPRIAVFAVSCAALPLIHHLNKKQLLAGVFTTEASNPDLYQLHQQLKAMEIPAALYQNTNDGTTLSTLDAWQANIGLVFTFSHILSDSIIQYFRSNVFNLHPSDLPNYRGPAPLYWQLRHGCGQLHMTLHRVTSEIDSGDIGLQEPMDIHPFDTLQTLNNRMAMKAPAFIEVFLSKLKDNSLDWQPQRPVNEATIQAVAPNLEHSLINWETFTTEDIINISRAGNPYYGGGLINFGSVQGQLLSARPSSRHTTGLKPGTILMIDRAEGFLVSTLNGSVNLEVISSQEGVFTGYKFAMLYNLSAGQRLLKQQSL